MVGAVDDVTDDCKLRIIEIRLQSVLTSSTRQLCLLQPLLDNIIAYLPSFHDTYIIITTAQCTRYKTRKLCYRKDVRAMHNPTIRTWFAARKSICRLPSSTDCWTVRAKIRQNGHFGGRRGETGSRNMAATQKIERALVTSYRPSIVTFWPTVLSVEPLVQYVVCRLSSVTFCIVAKWYVLAKNFLKE